ncbi:glutathione S-transferase N-terminal domain-containing protein [Microvirga sp. 3-52]|uniref:glutathione S-transferase N-terminal domain-containing protein n=1 Tax=Microvirga sp. 3-52 TaxID=2792425 RepID=UPI00289F8006|nr:glutathione S-transferase N-terminal domain-containing protein [Microvirga sp. 3-52]
MHLVRYGGEQTTPSYRAINPQGRVPALILVEDGIITQSSAILEYLEEAYSAQSPEKSFRLLRTGRGGLDCHTGGAGACLCRDFDRRRRLLLWA